MADYDPFAVADQIIERLETTGHQAAGDRLDAALASSANEAHLLYALRYHLQEIRAQIHLDRVTKGMVEELISWLNEHLK